MRHGSENEGMKEQVCVVFFSVSVYMFLSLCMWWGVEELEPINSLVWTTGPHSAFLSGHKGFSLPSLC